MILPPKVRQLTFGGEEIWLDPAAALFLPDYATLVVSDLHLAKGSALGRGGIPLPLYDSQDTLVRLELLMAVYKPEQVILLGDSFHDCQGWERLSVDEQHRILAMVKQVVSWHWVAGNHDPRMDTLLPGQHCTTLQIGKIHFSHQPVDGVRPLIVGHYHPKSTRRVEGIKVKGKAFIHDEALLIMPAFGSYAGGLELTDPVYQELIPNARSFIIHRDKIWQI